VVENLPVVSGVTSLGSAVWTPVSDRRCPSITSPRIAWWSAAGPILSGFPTTPSDEDISGALGPPPDDRGQPAPWAVHREGPRPRRGRSGWSPPGRRL